jgi:hypothetical protein
MSVRVVLQFSDEEHAKAFVAQALQHKGVPCEELVTASDGNLSLRFRRLNGVIIAVFKNPMQFCDPNDGHRGKKTSAGWTRGKKYGWWVCAACGKPTERWANGSLWPFSIGFNLLPASVSSWARGPKVGVKEWTEEECGLKSDGESGSS